MSVMQCDRRGCQNVLRQRSREAKAWARKDRR